MKLLVKDLIRKLTDLHNTDPEIEVNVLRECKACFKLTDENEVIFYRLDHKDRKKRKHKGYTCDKCGYINSKSWNIKTR